MHPLISDSYACVYFDVHLNQDLHGNLQNMMMQHSCGKMMTLQNEKMPVLQGQQVLDRYTKNT